MKPVSIITVHDLARMFVAPADSGRGHGILPIERELHVPP